MKAYKENRNGDKLYFTNYNRVEERIVFNEIFDILKSIKEIKIGDKIVGPSEDIYNCSINGEKFSLAYDIDYGGFIQSNSQEVLKLLEDILNKSTY